MEIKVNIVNKDQIMKIYASEEGYHIPTIAWRALNLTADQIKQALVEEMSKSLDRATPYTLNAPYVKYASKTNLAAYINFREWGGKSRSEKYLLTQARGGTRRLKGFESALRVIGILPPGMYAVPGRRAPLDAYGNISSGFILQILSYFRAFGEQGYAKNITEEKKAKMAAGTKKKRGFEYFAIRQPGKSLKPGIYRKTAFGFGKSTEPMIMFIERAAYRPLLKWNEIAQRVLDQNWERNFHAASQGVVVWGKGQGA